MVAAWDACTLYNSRVCFLAKRPSLGNGHRWQGHSGVMVIKTILCWHKIDVLTNGIELRIQIEVHATTVNWCFYKDAKNIYRREGRKNLRVVLGTGSTGKRMKLAPYPPARTKLKSRWIKEPSRGLMPGSAGGRGSGCASASRHGWGLSEQDW